MSFKIRDLLSAITIERKKSKSDEDDDFIYVQEVNPEWQNLFQIYFLSPTTRLPQTSTSTTSDDDLIFYVTRKIQSDTHQASHSVEVFRHHDVKRRPKLGATEYDWEETTNLNLVLHQFEYTVTTAVCIKTSNKHLQIVKRLSTRVYASPSRRDMENKGTTETITYPNMYFSVDNFEDAFCEMVVDEGQMVCVELVGKNPTMKETRVLFLGSIKYEALKKVYDTRATASARVAQRMTLGMYTKHRVEFVKMRGPNISLKHYSRRPSIDSILHPSTQLRHVNRSLTLGKGHAQMAVSEHRPAHSDPPTPKANSLRARTSSSDEGNEHRSRTNENSSSSLWVPPTIRQSHHAATAEVESIDIHQELSDDTGGFLGRTLNHAMNWVRHSNMNHDPSTHAPPLQTCLTFLTLPCHSIVKDILESNSIPMLTQQQSQ